MDCDETVHHPMGATQGSLDEDSILQTDHHKRPIEFSCRILKTTLHHKKQVTLDIDATEIIANKAGAQWTYKKNQLLLQQVLTALRRIEPPPI